MRPWNGAATCSPGSAVTPAPRASSCRPTAGRQFEARFLALAAEAAPRDPRTALQIDLALPALDVDYALFRELAGLAPCGPGNPEPLVAVLGLTVTRVRAASGGHSQLTLRRNLDVLDGIAFGRSDLAEVVHEGDRIDVVARLVSRQFGGLETLQLEIRDAATSGSHAEAAAILGCREPAGGQRGGRMTRPAARPPRAGDPYGLGPVRALAAPILSVVGLVLVALVTLSVMNGQVPFVGGKTGSNGNGNGNGNGGPQRTAAPSNVVIVPEVTFKGSIVYAKAGNIWVQTGQGRTPADLERWRFDAVLVCRRPVDLLHPDQGRGGPVAGPRARRPSTSSAIPDLMRVRADGSAEPERLATGRFKQGRFTWSYWMRQPVLSPDGTKIAMVTDAPNPENSNVVLQFFDTTTKKIKRAGVAESGVLGHQDPEWRPDGKYLLYVKNGRDGTRGAPIIVRYDPATGKTKGHHDGRVPEPVVLARRPVHRRHQDLELRDERRHPRRVATAGSCSA